MKQLIKITEHDGKKAVSAKALYEFLGYNKAVWKRWYTKNILNNKFAIENEDYIGFNIMLNGNETKDFALTIQFAKKISMQAQTIKGNEARDYFLWCEEKAKEQVLIIPNFSDPVQAARAWADAKEKEQKASKLLEDKSKQLDESKEWYSIKRYAKIHNMNWRNINWRALKAISHETGYNINKIFDANYGEVNIYHKDVFRIYFKEK